MKRMIAALAVVLMVSIGSVHAKEAKVRDLANIQLKSVEVGTPLNDTIVAFGTNYYEFEAPSAGIYRISIEGGQTDLSGMIFYDPEFYYFFFNCDKSWDAVDEVCDFYLEDGGKFYLMVDEWSDVDAKYQLLIQELQ